MKCKVGDIVSKDQVVVVLEAMKMEYPITAPAAGQVSARMNTIGGCLSRQLLHSQDITGHLKSSPAILTES